jgi:3'-phosphoadenosine 5'-phosphosulfate sulfotransferase (PAPS reductase)/FAD synthetase
MALDAAVDADALQLYARLTADDAPPQLRLPVREALAAIQAALRLYGRERLLLSFNGGKDATVLLHLARAAYAHAGLPPPRCVYWDDSDCFPEVVAFVEGAAAQHRLPLVRYTCSFADGLHDAVERLGTAAVLLGTRTGDPNGVGADTFQPSSPGWPPFMRVNPLLRWSYHDVWRLLRGFGLPCCALYERGYTSLGNTTNTAPNPALLRDDGTHAAADALLSGARGQGLLPLLVRAFACLALTPRPTACVQPHWSAAGATVPRVATRARGSPCLWACFASAALCLRASPATSYRRTPHAGCATAPARASRAPRWCWTARRTFQPLCVRWQHAATSCW